MSATPCVTQRDVAQACGVHPSTICLALKNAPSIPLETRRRIQAVAEELGYHPNVAARNLALLRTERKSGGSLPIAWLNQEERRDHWQADPDARVIVQAARRQAEASGFHLEEIWARQPGMTVARLIQIVRARGIEGVLFPVHREFDYTLLSPAWGEFALVGLNDLRLGEWIEVFAPDYYHHVDLAMEALRRGGFARPGFITTPRFEAASNGLAHSCFLRHQMAWASPDRVPVCIARGCGSERDDLVTEWLAQARPDVVLCAEPEVVPDEAGFGPVPWVHLEASAAATTGVHAATGEVAAAAIDALVGKMRRFETGLQAASRLHFLKGTWHPGALACEPVSQVA